MTDDPHISTWTPREHQIYEIGYREGGSSTEADWLLALEAGFGIEATDLNDAIQKLHGRIHTPVQT